MRRLASLTAIAAAALALLALPTAASAKTFLVNEIGDGADAATDGVCDAVAGGSEQCSLRAAIEESNATAAEKDKIEFNGVFDGQVTDKIALSGPLPITEPVTIEGPFCENAAGSQTGPCAEVSGPSGGVGLKVEDANDVTITRLAISGALTGIDVIDSSENFKAAANWIGVKLDGTAGPNNTGIFLDPDSNGAAIGKAFEGNVIANNTSEGLDIDGASNASIEGNLFGLKPDGVTKASNGKDIEITDSTAAPGFAATGNAVGGLLSAEQAATPACDGACNVISGAATHGIDLQGDGAIQEEAPASGSTTIQGNLIGLNAAGTGVVGNFRAGIHVREADMVQIGGGTAEVANRINGGEAGIQAGPSAQDLKIEGNRIGLDAAGTGEELAPETEGIAVRAEGTMAGHAATIVQNRIAMAGGIAIEVEKNGATGTTIADNVIGRGVGGEHLTAGAFGIRLDGPQGTGSTIEGNIVENAHLIGLLIESSNNRVAGNEILGTDEESGIVIQKLGPQASSGNIIGGDTAAEENVISGSGSNAIEIVDGIDTDNQILRNTGSDNAGLFIDLGRDGLGNLSSGPNDGIQAPIVSAATPTMVTGTGALANATIRVFEGAPSDSGEVKGFLGLAKADGAGKWLLTYESQLPLGTKIGVDQTGFEGTSELAQATTANPPPPAPGGDGQHPILLGLAVGVGVRITKAPKKRSNQRTAQFRFEGGPGTPTFECKLDRGPFKKCRSPKKYRHLKPGKHVFRVRAIAAGGEVSTPAVKKFTVLN